ncbi:hypothetical protein WOLCODRAFT_140191 [Wolfiporia cocos MD-104 SS10]|uniref:Vacuolar sorting protein Vps3844 C-terminal domain-containing protein n=1 Tax=Wolfiporia cocos (strain MD-104) TaxID=742152 RepID=A0A2H3J224_WOLCO|nr:hypothetical protein WOLCODRAFT_140191 [Wolfiporia cocos MD-104 SS10]
MRALSACLLLASSCYATRVYFHPDVPALPAVVTPRGAGVALSRHLGLDFHEYLEEDSELLYYASQQESFVGFGPGAAVLLSVGEDVAADVLPSTFKQTFVIDPEPSPETLSSLVSTYLDRAQHAYSHIFTETTLPEHAPRILDTFSVPSSANERFVSEMSTLVGFIDIDDVPTDKFTAVELTGLSALAEEYGHDSEQYTTAAATLETFIERVLMRHSIKLAVMVVPSFAQTAKRQDANAFQPPQSPLPPPVVHPAEPVDAVATCHASVEACANVTSSCSGHGECVQASKAGRTCFVCACASTRDTRGRTEYWAGSACERQDVSGPFVLLTGTVVALIILVGGSIALLSGVGDQELPNTLTGGVVPTTRKD